MGLPFDNPYLEVATYALIVLALAASIFLWGRGIRKARTSDLIAGPAILFGLSIVLNRLFCFTAFRPAILSLNGTLFVVFGVATVLLSPMASAKAKLKGGYVAAIGLGAILLGVLFMITS